jgi:hypothetical protein
MLLWPLIPAAVAIAKARADAGSLVAQWSVLLIASMFVAGAIRARAARIVIAIAVASYVTSCLIFAIHRLAWNEWMDVGLIFAYPVDTVRSIVLTAGITLTVAALLATLAHIVLYALAMVRVARALEPSRRFAIASGLAAVFVLAFAAKPHKALLLDENVVGLTESIRPLQLVQPYDVAAAEPIFIVQLESLNGIASNGEYDVGDPQHRGATEVMRRIAQQGIYFPYVWNHDVQTHRAQQNLLCDAIGNVTRRPVFDVLERDPRCLPRLLANAGYRTVFLSSYADPMSSGTEALMKRAGYDDARFADFMQPGDALASWGYDEVAFFRRAFEYLRRTYRSNERLFVHLSVCAHHVGFAREHHADGRWMRAPREQQVAQYLESARKQDRSLDVFWQQYVALTGGNAHLFIIGDHSYPLGLYGSRYPMVGATIDNFVTSMAYIPPCTRSAEFAAGRVLETLHAHSDVQPTIAELLTRRPHQNSLVPFMARNAAARADYEQCHVMTQPFGSPTVFIARGEEAYVYSFLLGCVDTYRLTSHPLRQHRTKRACRVSYEQFESQYGCKRFRRM